MVAKFLTSENHKLVKPCREGPEKLQNDNLIYAVEVLIARIFGPKNYQRTIHHQNNEIPTDFYTFSTPSVIMK